MVFFGCLSIGKSLIDTHSLHIYNYIYHRSQKACAHFLFVEFSALHGSSSSGLTRAGRCGERDFKITGIF